MGFAGTDGAGWDCLYRVLPQSRCDSPLPDGALVWDKVRFADVKSGGIFHDGSVVFRYQYTTDSSAVQWMCPSRGKRSVESKKQHPSDGEKCCDFLFRQFSENGAEPVGIADRFKPGIA